MVHLVLWYGRGFLQPSTPHTTSTPSLLQYCFVLDDVDIREGSKHARSEYVPVFIAVSFFRLLE